MTMTEQRREEIRAAHANVTTTEHATVAEYETAEKHWDQRSVEYAGELLDENQRLADELDSLEASRDRAWTHEHELLHEISTLKARLPEPFPVVTICGSMKFYDRMLKVAARLTSAGHIVLMPHDASLTGIENKTAIEHGAMLDEMHRAKIRLSGSIYVVNTGGYIGESTRGEIDYATKLGLPIQYDEEA
jgi:hypothetical protein